MRTTIDLDDSLLRRLRDAAHREGVPFRTLLHRVIQRGLEAPHATGADAYVAPSFAMGHVPPEVSLVKALQLAASLDDAEVVHELARRR